MNIAELLGAEKSLAETDMHNVINFEIELSMVSCICIFQIIYKIK